MEIYANPTLSLSVSLSLSLYSDPTRTFDGNLVADTDTYKHIHSHVYILT